MKQIVLVVLLFQGVPIHAWSWTSVWSKVCTAVHTLSDRMKMALTITTGAAMILLYKYKSGQQKPSSQVPQPRPNQNAELIPPPAQYNYNLGEAGYREQDGEGQPNQRVLEEQERINALVDAIEAGKSLREIQGLALNIDVNKPDKDGYLPLVEAASHRRPSVVRFLIVRGADINRADQHGVKPLQALTTTLAHERRFKTIEVLCQHRVSFDGIDMGSLGPAIMRVNAKYRASN